METKKKAVTVKDIANKMNISLSAENKALTDKKGIGEIFQKSELSIFLVGTSNKEKMESFAQKISENKNLKLVDVVETSDKEDVAKELIEQHPDIQGIYVSTAVAEPICKYIKKIGLAGKVKVITTDVYPQLVKIYPSRDIEIKEIEAGGKYMIKLFGWKGSLFEDLTPEDEAVIIK